MFVFLLFALTFAAAVFHARVAPRSNRKHIVLTLLTVTATAILAYGAYA